MRAVVMGVKQRFRWIVIVDVGKRGVEFLYKCRLVEEFGDGNFWWCV
jgi:hypothetical protein